MKIKTTYIGTLNGVKGFWCGFKPENLEITEERNVLYSEDGYTLKRKSDNEIVGTAIWLQDDDKESNYEEVEEIIEEPLEN